MSPGKQLKAAWKKSGKAGSLKKFAASTGDTAWRKRKTKAGRIKRTRKPRITRQKATATTGGKKK